MSRGVCGATEAVDHQVDLAVGQALPVAGARQRPREQRRGDDQVLGGQVRAQLAGGLPALDQPPQDGADVGLAAARVAA